MAARNAVSRSQAGSGLGRLARSAAAGGPVMASGQFPLAAWLLAAGLALVAGQEAGARDELRRCEDAAGHVTYSNEACPTGTARERGVENRPAVEVPHDGPAEKKAALASKPAGIVPSAVPAPVRTAEHEEEMAREQKKSLVARCDDLVRRIEYGQQDLLTAAPGERASVELGVRRLQEEYEANCSAH